MGTGPDSDISSVGRSGWPRASPVPSLLSVAPSLKGRGWPRYLRGLHLQLPEVPDGAHAAVHTETLPLPRGSWGPCLPATNAGPRATVTETSKGYGPLTVSPSLRTCRMLLLAPQRSLQKGLMTPWVFTVAAGEGSEHSVVSRWTLTMQLGSHHKLSEATGQPGMQRTERGDPQPCPFSTGRSWASHFTSLRFTCPVCGVGAVAGVIEG